MASSLRPTRRSLLLTASLGVLVGCSEVTSPPSTKDVEDLLLGWREVPATRLDAPWGPRLLGPTVGDWSTGTHLLNVWASWCGPCIKELPLLQGASEQVEEWRVIGVSTDQVADNAAAALDAAGVGYTNFQDPGSVYVESLAPFIPISAVPSSVLISAGEVVAAHVGPFKRAEDITYARTYL